jgi:hypothetical protein
MVAGLPVARLASSLPETSGPVVWLPNGRKGAGIRKLSFAPDRDPDAGPTAQEFTSWSALTSMRPGQTVPSAVE